MVILQSTLRCLDPFKGRDEQRRITSEERNALGTVNAKTAAQ